MKRKLIYVSSAVLIAGCAGMAHKGKEPVSGESTPVHSPAAFYREPSSTTDFVKTEERFNGQSFLHEYENGVSKATIVGKHKLFTFIDWVGNNSTALFKELRAERPFLEVPEIPHIKDQLEGKQEKLPMVVVTMDQDVRNVFDQPELFSVRLYQHKMDTSVSEFMLAHDKKDVNKEKVWMRAMLKREDLPRVKKMVEELTKKAIAEGNVSGRIELVNAVARRVPLELSGKYFGFPGPNLRAMYRWSRATQYSFFNNVTNKEEYEEKALTAGAEMKDYMQKYLAKKRADKSYENEDTVFSRLIKMNVSDDEMMNVPDGRKIVNILGTLIGGVETTQQAIVNVVDFFLDYPEMFEEALKAAEAGNDALFGKYVWEALRFRPVNPFIFRLAEKDFVLAKGTSREYHGKKGQVVIVATESAMFDPARVKNPYQFSVNRIEINAPESVYLHLGYGHHKCLGDYIAAVEVPEVVKQILMIPGLRRVNSIAGKIGRHDNIGALELVEDKAESPFPESFLVDTDLKQESKISMADPRFAFEDYLTDYDRGEFRNCLSNTKTSKKKWTNVISSIPKNIKQRKKSTDAIDLFLCRLPAKFHQCVGGMEDGDYVGKYESCKKNLTTLQNHFYKHEIMDAEFDLKSLKSLDVVNKNSDIENDLKFYDRADFRQAFMNPVGSLTMPDNNQLIYYSRLDLKFRKCVFAGTKLKFQSRAEAFKKCQEDDKIAVDSLTAKYFEEIMLR